VAAVTLVAGAATMLAAGWAALRQTDLKLLLARHGEPALPGRGDRRGTRRRARRDRAAAGARAVQAALFLVVGVIDHTTGTRDLR
jgi:multicomponent Na+:H+ antiporter subunit A